jgi:hypothetical protein
MLCSTEMRRSRLLRPDPFGSALARLIAAPFSDDAFTFLIEEEEVTRLQLLQRAKAELDELRCRTLRASCPGSSELRLHDLVSQLCKYPVRGDVRGDELERSHRLLTEVDPSCDRVVLIVDGAQLLSSSALRFLQLTSRSGPHLRIVLASTATGAANPVAPEFSLLQARSARIRLGQTTERTGGQLLPL